MFGGNSNWRGPVWMPLNYLIIRSLRNFGAFYGEDLQIEFPSGSGRYCNLQEVADLLSQRILSLFTRDHNGERKSYEAYNWFYQRRENKDLVLFYEYFHGDTGKGLGASHQTGWTALIANLLQEL